MTIPPSPSEISPLDRQNVVALEEAPPSPARRILIEIIETIVLALVLFFAINFVTARIRVEGSSMDPNFHDGDYVVVNRLAYKLGEIQRGDVIVFPYPLNPEEDYIKRVIGLPGDRLAIYGGVLYINGQAITEPYISRAAASDMEERVVPDGHVFLLGDNRNASSDSRTWGPLPIEDILGKAVFRYFPFDSISIITHPVISVSASN
ncbi:MAG: signal peptidase I [Anaerolineales bacterium]